MRYVLYLMLSYLVIQLILYPSGLLYYSADLGLCSLPISLTVRRINVSAGLDLTLRQPGAVDCYLMHDLMNLPSTRGPTGD